MGRLFRPGALAKLTVVSLITIATTGCIPGIIGFVPTPGALAKDSPRANIANDVIDKLIREQATRSDVLLRLGDATERISDDRFLVYEWRSVDTIFAVNLGYGGVYGGPVAGTAHFICLEFGPDHRLVQSRRFDTESREDAHNEMLQWIDEQIHGEAGSDDLHTEQ